MSQVARADSSSVAGIKVCTVSPGQCDRDLPLREVLWAPCCRCPEQDNLSAFAKEAAEKVDAATLRVAQPLSSLHN